MKKSELLNEIQWLILESDCIDVPNSALINEVKLAKLILDLVESSGMLPPEIKNPSVKQDSLISWATESALDKLHDRRPKVPDEYFVNEWESEDEV